jgi:hypothetical protein
VVDFFGVKRNSCHDVISPDIAPELQRITMLLGRSAAQAISMRFQRDAGDGGSASRRFEPPA